MSFVGKLLSVDQMLMAAAAVHPEAPQALPMIEACRSEGTREPAAVRAPLAVSA